MVADPSGKSAVLEYVGEKDATDTDPTKRQLKVQYNDPDISKKGQIVTNFVLRKDYYDQAADKKGLDRYTLLQTELAKKAYKLNDETEAMNLLGQVAGRNWPNDDENCITTHSVIYNLTKKTAFGVTNEHYQEPAYHYHFAFK